MKVPLHLHIDLNLYPAYAKDCIAHELNQLKSRATRIIKVGRFIRAQSFKDLSLPASRTFYSILQIEIDKADRYSLFLIILLLILYSIFCKWIITYSYIPIKKPRDCFTISLTRFVAYVSPQSLMRRIFLIRTIKNIVQ